MIGSIEAPTTAEIAQQAQESPFAAMIGLLPPDTTEVIANLCKFKCPIHTMLGETTDGAEKRGEENDGEADPLDREAQERAEQERIRRANFGGGYGS